MRVIPVFLILITILTACAPIVPGQAHPTPASTESAATQPEAASESQVVVLDGTFETSLLATVWMDKTEGNLLFPVDPASGTALPGHKPISLGFSSIPAFSPDHRKLAVVSFPTEVAHNGSLVLIDLPTWKTQRFDLELFGWVSNIVFSPDGNRLAIAHGESNYTLTVFDATQGLVVAQGKTDSSVSRLKFTEGGESLMLYSPTINTTNQLSTGPPQILLLDAADLSLLWMAELEGIRDGIFLKDENVTSANIHEPGQALYIMPGLAFAPERDALYIVHADSEQLTTVDFENQKVETVEIQARRTWIERLLSLTAGVAHAKIGDGIVRQAAVSPDGQFLYVVGVNNATFQDKQGNWQMEQTPLGLEIIETRDGSRVGRIETHTTELSLSPDGRFLYLRNWGNNEDHLPWTEIFDTSSQQLVARKDNVSAIPALLMNGEFLLASTFSTSEYSHHMSILEPDGSSVLAEWTDSESVWWLTAP